MPNWNTETVINDLRTIVGVESISHRVPNGDHDTDNLTLLLAGTDGQNLLVRGFNPDFRIFDTSDGNVPMVELSDGLSKYGGLSSHDFRVARAYIDVRQYFINRGFEVCTNMNDCI